MKTIEKSNLLNQFENLAGAENYPRGRSALSIGRYIPRLPLQGEQYETDRTKQTL